MAQLKATTINGDVTLQTGGKIVNSTDATLELIDTNIKLTGATQFVGNTTGLTVATDVPITLGAQTLKHDGTDFVFDDSVNLGANDLTTTGTISSNDIVSTYTQGKRTRQYWESDCFNTSYGLAPWTPGATSSGAFSYVSAYFPNRPGLLYPYSSATVRNSGYYLTSGTTLAMSGGMKTSFLFRPVSSAATTLGNVGFMNQIGITPVQVGAYFDIKGNTVRAITAAVSGAGTPTGIRFSADGTKMYYVGTTNDTVYQCELSSAYELCTATTPLKKKELSEDTAPTDIFFKPDGTKMFMVGSTGDKVYSYSLGSAWDIETLTYDGSGSDVSILTQDNTPQSVCFSSDGTKMLVLGITNDKIYTYNLGSAWDTSTATYGTGSDYSIGTEDTVMTGMDFNDDGTKMVLCGDTNNRVYYYTLSTGWDLTSTVTYVTYATSGDSVPTGVVVKNDGSKYWTIGQNSDLIREYNITTPWDFSAVVYYSGMYVNSYGTASTTTYTLDPALYYYFTVRSNSDASACIFEIFSSTEDGVAPQLLWTETITTTLPNSNVASAISYFNNSAVAERVNMIYIDWMELEINRVINR